MIPDMVDKLAPNSTHFTRGLDKYIPSRGYFRVVPSQNGDKVVTPRPPPPPIVGRVFFSDPGLESRQASSRGRESVGRRIAQKEVNY